MTGGLVKHPPVATIASVTGNGSACGRDHLTEHTKTAVNIDVIDSCLNDGFMESETLCVRSNFYLPRNTSYQSMLDYDFNRSSEQNYNDPLAPFVGKYKEERSKLDYSYHRRYSMDRQYLHDKLIDRFLDTVVRDSSNNITCDTPLQNWIVFTAGPMGAGKGHTIQWLHQQDLFPLDAFVNVDPDALRSLLPEIATYNKINPETAGYLTQKEVGYISEVLTHDALNKGKNVLVDGSLRNAPWYLQYFRDLRSRYPNLKICILHVTARAETVLARARKRASVTGRVVPEEVILDSMRSIPNSLRILCPQTDFFVNFINEDEYPEPFLSYCCAQHMLPPTIDTKEEVEEQWEMDWCIRGRSCCVPKSRCGSADSMDRRDTGVAIDPIVDDLHEHFDEAMLTAAAAPVVKSQMNRNDVYDGEMEDGCNMMSTAEFNQIAEYVLYDFALQRRSSPEKYRKPQALIPSVLEEDNTLDSYQNYQGQRIASWKSRFQANFEMQCAMPDCLSLPDNGTSDENAELGCNAKRQLQGRVAEAAVDSKRSKSSSADGGGGSHRSQS